MIAGLRADLERFRALVAEPQHWTSPTACEGWQSRDLAGHILDAGRGYLAAFDAAASGTSVTTVPPEQRGAAYDDAARAFRGTPREEVLDQLWSDSDELVRRFEALGPDEWTGLFLTDRYAGPLPAGALATGMLAGSAVHTWDLAQGRGRSHPLDAEVAELLVPFVFALWAFTGDTSGLTSGFDLGLRVSGRTGGDHRVAVNPGSIDVSAEAIDDCPTVLEVDPGTLILLAYHRVDAGTVHGDRSVLDTFWSVVPPP